MMSKTPTVSVLTPVYNAEKFLAASIESILNQTFSNFEYIILDDASTDNSWNIIKYYANRDKRIRAYRNKQNLYIAKSRNRLINLSKGKYIAWQDADDVSLPHRLQRQFQYLEQHSQVGIVGGYLEFIDEDGNKISIRKYAADDASLRKLIFRYSPVAQPVAMIRRECFKLVGLYNPKYPQAEDIDMSFRIGQIYNFANIPEVLLQYRNVNSSTTHQKLKKIELTTIKVRFHYAKLSSYKFSLIDVIYNLLQLITLFITPSRLRISIFNYFRNQKN